MYSVDIYNRVRRACLKDGTPAKAHDKQQLSGPVLRRDLIPFYSAMDKTWCLW